MLQLVFCPPYWHEDKGYIEKEITGIQCKDERIGGVRPKDIFRDYPPNSLQQLLQERMLLSR